jgi:hypothetical protein
VILLCDKDEDAEGGQEDTQQSTIDNYTGVSIEVRCFSVSLWVTVE